ncbi:YbhB/YbcL family Raf kinase inhibitor-like protein [Kineococcus sp. SYSU DK005]|uniref:YbhB/YbcL family Raf kinase inhibitor-like protein n=1 Tax=Kineococcus sp. SYSU DK005 TaxID=3383126 RepID=UPI003D7CAABA
MSHDPYALAFPAPVFSLSSPDVDERGELPRSAYAEEGDRSPALAWTDLPEGTRSVLVTAYDADAPVPGGLWHWVLTDVPATAGGLAAGAGSPGGAVPGARALPNDLGRAGYSGVNPPAGTGVHRLFIAATALDVDHLDLPADASTALVHVLAIPHTLGRAVLVATSEAPSA